MSEDDVRMVMKQPWVAIASDGSALNLDEEGVPHPRSFSTNPRVLGYYVREEQVLTLEDAVRKMTIAAGADSRPSRSRSDSRRFCRRPRHLRSGRGRRNELVREAEELSGRNPLHDRQRRGRHRRRQTYRRASGPAAFREEDTRTTKIEGVVQHEAPREFLMSAAAAAGVAGFRTARLGAGRESGQARSSSPRWIASRS